MKPVLLPLFSPYSLTDSIIKLLDCDVADLFMRSFPDGESYLQFKTSIENRHVIIIASLNQPNDKIIPLLFSAECARDLGAKSVGLIAPYLAYMRQDKRFKPGEGITSKYFAKILSSHFDWMITVAPHLHRYHSLSEIYKIPTQVIQATNPIVQWIKRSVNNPMIIGPDMESEQWVQDVAQHLDAPLVILEKLRKGDKEVEFNVPKIEIDQNLTPILIDDIISTAKTMIGTVKHLHDLKLKIPICIGVHGLFCEQAFSDLENAGVAKIVTTNTIAHASNDIDIGPEIVKVIKKFIQ